MSIRSALLLGGAMIVLSLTVAYTGNAGYLGEENSRRVMQVAAGLVVVYFANLAPKGVEPLCAGCEPSRVQALQRFSGRTLLLGGLGYSLAWLVVPIDHAAVASMVILGTCLLSVVARYVGTVTGRS